MEMSSQMSNKVYSVEDLTFIFEDIWNTWCTGKDMYKEINSCIMVMT